MGKDLSNKFYKKGANLENIQEMNRSLVLRLIQRLNICSRATIAKETGLKQATITNIVNDLIGWGLLKETGIIDGEKGRRSIDVTLSSEKYKVIGLRLTRNYYSTAIFDLSGDYSHIKTEPINIMDGSKSALENIERSISEIIKKSPQYKIVGLGMAIPGPFFKSEGRIGLMSEFPGWEDINLEEEIKSIFKFPVYLEHDANAGALAEWLARPHYNMPGTMIYIAAGQGIGAGIIIDGKLFRGSQGIAGEIGHTSIDYNGLQCSCGFKGCLEQYCSTISLVKDARSGLGKNPESILSIKCDLESIIKAVGENDKYAVSMFEKTAGFLAIGIVNIINTFNPDLIIIGDELSRFNSKLLEFLKEKMKKMVLAPIFNNISLELSNFKSDPALIGAGDLVIDNILHRPSIIKKLL